MADKERPEPEREPGLPPDRCPACDGPLQIVKDQAERFCPHCGIYLEVLAPLAPGEPTPEQSPETIARRREQAKLHIAYESFAAGGEKGEEAGKDAEGRPAEAVPPTPEPVPAPESPPPSTLEATPPTPPPTQPILAAPEQQVLPPRAEEPKALPPGEAPPPAAAAGTEARTERNAETAVEVPPRPPEAPEPLAPALPEAPGPETPAPQVPAPTEVHAEPPPRESQTVETYECPTCGTALDADTKACPKCGAIFDASVLESFAETEEVIVEEPVPIGPTPSGPVAVVVPHTAAASRVAAGPKAERGSRPSRADRAIFYVGAAIVAVGGSGLMLGSVVHDFFRVPFVGRAYEVFGPLNFLAFLVGGMFLTAGTVAMAIGARRGSRRTPRAAGG